MFRSISADFYSSDEAEVASINIKNQIRNIKTVDIINQNQNRNTRVNTDSNYGFTGLVTNNISSNFPPLAFGLFGTNVNDNSNNSDYDNTKNGSTATLKLSCEERDLPSVSILLSSYGGHNIEKNQS